MFVAALTIFSYLFGAAVTGLTPGDAAPVVNGLHLHGNQANEEYNYLAVTSIKNEVVRLPNRTYIEYDYSNPNLSFGADEFTYDYPLELEIKYGDTYYPLCDMYYGNYGGIPTLIFKKHDNQRYNIAFTITYFPYNYEPQSPFNDEGIYMNFDLSLPNETAEGVAINQTHVITHDLFDDDDVALDSYFKLVFNFYTINNAQYQNADSQYYNTIGYGKGYSDGYNDGYQAGRDYQMAQDQNDYTSGYNNGYDKGKQEGYSQGYDNGYEVGLIDGVDNFISSDEYEQEIRDSYLQGFDQGKYIGHEQGYAEALAEGNDYTFRSLFGAIADTPILFIRQLLGFEIFGVEAVTILMTMITGVIILFLVRKIVL